MSKKKYLIAADDWLRGGTWCPGVSWQRCRLLMGDDKWTASETMKGESSDRCVLISRTRTAAGHSTLAPRRPTPPVTTHHHPLTMNRIVAILLALMGIVALLGSGVQAAETRAVARPASRHKNKNKWGSHHKNKNKDKGGSHHGSHHETEHEVEHESNYEVEHESNHEVEHESNHESNHGSSHESEHGSTDTCSCVAQCIQKCAYSSSS